MLTTKISASAPAFSNARAVSYSQLVPGNTGMSTFTRPPTTAGAFLLPFAYEYVRGAAEADCGARVGYTLSSVPANASYSLSSETRSPPQTTAGSSVVCPIQSAPAGTAVHSSRNAPCIGANSMSGSDTPSSVRPTPLPKHILAAASAT